MRNMKKHASLMIILGFAVTTLFFAACSNNDSIFEYDDGIDESYGNFWALKLRDGKNEWYRVDAPFVGAGQKCTIYVEKSQQKKVSADSARLIAYEFDNNIYPKMISAFGAIEDVDNDGKVLLLILDINDGYAALSSGGYVGGYFQPDQMRAANTFRYSNGHDMLYIDSNPQIPTSKSFYSTIAHELQHLINYSQTVAKGKRQKTTWINEGLSTAAEYVYGEDPNSRVDYYLRLQNNSSTKLEAKQDSFYIWDGSLSDYSSAYLFFQWLRIQSKQDIEIYKSILFSDNADFEAVLNAIKDTKVGFSDQNIIPKDWKTVMKSWFLSNYYYANKTMSIGYGLDKTFTDKITNRIDSLNRLITQNVPVESLVAPFESTTEYYASFRNGEGVFCKLKTTIPSIPYSAGISYCRLDKSKKMLSITDDPIFYGDGVLLVYNHNTTQATTIQGLIPKSATLIQTFRSMLTKPNPFDALPQEPYMIDVQF